MPQPTLTRLDTEATQMKKLQEENNLLRSRIQSMGNQLSQPSASSSPKSSSSTTHQSRRSTFHEQKRLSDNKPHMQINPNPNSLNDVIPFYIPPPPHLGKFISSSTELYEQSNILPLNLYTYIAFYRFLYVHLICLHFQLMTFILLLRRQ